MYKNLMLGAAIALALASTGIRAEETAAAPNKDTDAPKVESKDVATPAPSAAAVPSDLSEKLKPLLGVVPTSLKATPVPGIFEAKFDSDIVYVSSDGRYIFSGDLLDLQSKTSLTEAARSTERKALVDSIDASKTIEFKAKGDEKHVLYVFTDVECPFCVKLHKEVPALNDKGVTVRYLAYPRAGIGSPAYKKMVNVWCADNKQDALTKVKNGEEIPTKECTNPVADDFELGQKLGVNGTPALLTADGQMIPGFRPADQLVKMLDAKDAKTKAN